MDAEMTAQERYVFLKDAARQVVAAWFSNDERALKAAMGYLAECVAKDQSVPRS